MVKRRRLELPRHNCHYPLKVARLPIPPPLQHFKIFRIPCPRQDSNLHVVKHTHLKRARLPIPPLGHRSFPPVLVYSECRAENGTRTRDPDLGKVVLYQLSYFRSKNPFVRSISLNAVAKVRFFLKLQNFFVVFFKRKRRLVYFIYKI